MATRRPFWKWRHWKSIGSYPYIQVLCHLSLECRWKSIGSYPYIQVLCHLSLELIFKAKLKLESGNQKIQYGCLAAILKLTLLKINRLLHIYISIVLLKFGVDIQSQTKVSPETKKIQYGHQAAILKVKSLKSMGSYPHIQVLCHSSLELIFKAKLKLESGNQKIQYGCLVAILKLTLLKINRLLHMYISIVLLQFGVDIQSQTKVKSVKTKQGKSEGFESCDWPIVRKRPIWVKIGDVLYRVTLKFDRWPWKTIGHLSFAVSSFAQHFIAIGEFKLELQSGNAHFGSNSTIFRAVWPWNLTDDLEKQ